MDFGGCEVIGYGWARVESGVEVPSGALIMGNRPFDRVVWCVQERYEQYVETHAEFPGAVWIDSTPYTVLVGVRWRPVTVDELPEAEV